MAFIENTVDPNTGTVTAKARIANANEGLWPGQFVKAEVVLGVEPEALAVPAPAVQLGPQGPYVFVVKDGNVAEVRPVAVKRTQGGESVDRQRAEGRRIRSWSTASCGWSTAPPSRSSRPAAGPSAAAKPAPPRG